MEKGKLLGQGRTAEIYAYGDRDVLKLFRKEMNAAAAEYEYKIGKIVQKTGMKVPETKELLDIDGRKGIIIERVIGNSMLKTMTINPLRLKSLAKQFAGLHYSIHKKTSFELPSLKESLKERIGAADELTEESKELIINYLAKLPDGNSICHFDFHPDNIMMTENGPVIIDLVTCKQGNSLADVARTVVILKCAQVPPDKSFAQKVIVNGFRSRLLKYYLKEYLKLSGAKLKDMEMWELPIAAARLVEWLPSEEKRSILNLINVKIKNLKYI